jgi:hypothetical protein
LVCKEKSCKRVVGKKWNWSGNMEFVRSADKGFFPLDEELALLTIIKIEPIARFGLLSDTRLATLVNTKTSYKGLAAHGPRFYQHRPACFFLTSRITA